MQDPGLEHAPALMRLASTLARSDAEDLVQATWVRALEHDAPVRARRSWLRKILVNERNMSVRTAQRRRDRDAAAGQPEASAIEVEDVVHCLDVARTVNDLVDELDDDVRLVVRERYFDGNTAADIARKHAIPAGTVRWRLKSGLDRLRSRLDERYGGRRALWAGGFVTPTLSETAASEAAKGTTAMSTKILAAIALTAGTAGGAAYVVHETNTTEAAPVAAPTTATAVAVAPADKAPEHDTADTPSPAAPTRAATTTAKPARAASPAQKAAWRHRRDEIHAAHQGSHPEHAEGCDHEEGHIMVCEDEGCWRRLADEVMAMFEGCSHLTDQFPPDLALKANVIGAPDVGLVVDSVELQSDADVPEEVEECLTETMYTLELGPADQNFAQEITVMMSTSMAESLEGLDDSLEGLDEETRAKIEEAMKQEGGAAQFKVIHLEE